MPKWIGDKLLSWASLIEDNTLDQALVASQMPFVDPYIALMPDAHLGKGATVGSVIPTREAIMPAAVGVDIGCGMIAVQTQFTIDDLGGLDRTVLHKAIASAIPLFAGKYNQTLTKSAERRVRELDAMPGSKQAWAVSPNWSFQLGSLGSGNHFIEVSLDEANNVWLFLHSGSRGVGNKLAMVHIKAAQAYVAKTDAFLRNPDLAYLIEGTEEFDAYIEALTWAQHFAWLNRWEMMNRVVDVFGKWIGKAVVSLNAVHCHHNYTEKAEINGRSVWLSRKGAIAAHAGERGLIPGSMATASYVVEGKGDPTSFWSAPHGAGRQHSRTSAKKTFTYQSLEDSMEGIAWGESIAFLDEHPEAYKPVDVVMHDAVDLVEIKHTLHQIVNVKGN
jgi:tRNA-splicing ligase RtcB